MHGQRFRACTPDCRTGSPQLTGTSRERVGETMKRLSFQKLLEVTDTPAAAYHVKEPRSNPYIFFKEEEVPGGWNRDLAAYRSRHQR